MKKHIIPILLAIWPYLSVGLFLLINLLGSAGYSTYVPLVLAAAVLFLSPVMGAGGLGFGLKEHDISPEALAKYTLLVKLVHVPFYVGIFLGVIMVPVGAAFFFLFDVMAMCCSAGLGVAAQIRAGKAGLIPTGGALLHGICQCLFVADVISAFLVWRRLKKET